MSVRNNHTSNIFLKPTLKTRVGVQFVNLCHAHNLLVSFSCVYTGSGYKYDYRKTK